MMGNVVLIGTWPERRGFLYCRGQRTQQDQNQGSTADRYPEYRETDRLLPWIRTGIKAVTMDTDRKTRQTSTTETVAMDTYKKTRQGWLLS